MHDNVFVPMRLQTRGGAENPLHLEEEMHASSEQKCLDPRETIGAKMESAQAEARSSRPGRIQSSSKLLEIRRHRIVLVRFARLTPVLSPVVLADASPAALLASVLPVYIVCMVFMISNSYPKCHTMAM